jgi:F-type H+-transporting ATPase subunit delta
MAELSTIARPYAEALFAASGSAKDAAGPWLAALDAVAGLVAQPSVAQSLSLPGLSDENRFELISSLCGQSLPAPIAELLKVVLQNDRLSALPEIASQFHTLRNASDGVADCLIESAFPMSEAEVGALVAALARKFPVQLKPEVRVNQQLIGGVRVTVGDRVLDSSVRARLDAMRGQLTA